MNEIDLAKTKVHELNAVLHGVNGRSGDSIWRVLNPRGRHSIAVGLNVPLTLTVDGHVGYYCGGMNKEADITITGNAGSGVGENIMSGMIRVKGNASQYAGASGQGGMLVIEGDAAARCGISMKGVNIVVGGSVGHMSAFMAQAGNLVVCGDAGHHLGDSIYEANLYVRGSVDSLGADCIEKELRPEHIETLERLLQQAGIKAQAKEFRRYGSARKLYNFHIDHADHY
jgi:methylamine---glutamate N-methyltransferase subunit B